MTAVFEADRLADVPRAGGQGVLLTARRDLDIASEARARAEIAAAGVGSAAAVLLDLSHVFVGVAAIRCIRDVCESGPRAVPLAVIGAPRWLAEVTALLGVGQPPFVRTTREAVAVLRAADRARGALPAPRRRAPALATRCATRRP
jgi:hypothetical protein